ncbi:Unknown protein, partial [Striga hermonthica]
SISFLGLAWLLGFMAEDLGERFQNIHLSAKESGGVELEDGDVRISAEECRRSLLGKIIGDRKATKFGIRRTMSFVWQTAQPFEVKELGPNFFQFIFGCKEDKDKVMAGVNWVFENQYLILQDWREDISENDGGFSEVSLWMQVHKLPLHWLSTDVGLKIGRLFQRVRNVIVVKEGGTKGSFLRLLVSHDVKEPLPRCTVIKLGSRQYNVSFQYEKLVSLCYYCGLVGHLERDCKTRLAHIEEGQVQEGQFGDWMKAADLGRGFGSPSNSYPSPRSNSQSNFSNPGDPSNSDIHQGKKRDGEQAALTVALIPVTSSVAGEKDDDIHSTCLPVTPNKGDPAVGETGSAQNTGKELSMELWSDSTVVDASQKQMKSSKTHKGKQHAADAMKVHLPTFVFISETRKSKFFVDTVCKKLGFADRRVIVDPVGMSGGLMVGWSREIEVLQVLHSYFCIQIQFKIDQAAPSEWMIFIYGSTDRQTRDLQWKEVEQNKDMWGEKWCIGGDWNDICSSNDKRGGRQRSPGSCEGFNKFITNMGMMEVTMEGYPFTWGNNRQEEGFVEEKLDRVFGSFSWLAANSGAKVSTVFKSSSDHFLLLLDSGNQKGKFFKRFVFYKRWLKMEGCAEEVGKAWSENVPGCPMIQVKEKIKKTRMALIKWSKLAKSGNALKIEELTLKLEQMRALGGQVNWDEWEHVRKELEDSHLKEEEFWSQKARLQWLKEGDRNTKFFHAMTLYRRKRNAISRLVDNQGLVADTPELIELAIIKFYKSLFETEGSWGEAARVNLSKSSVFFSRNASDGIKSEVCQVLNGIDICTSTRYLGLPMGLGRSKKEVFQF